MASALEAKEEERKAAQNELDDLLIVFSDLEEKAEKYKVRLGSRFVWMCVLTRFRNASRLWERMYLMGRMKTKTKTMKSSGAGKRSIKDKQRLDLILRLCIYGMMTVRVHRH